MPNKIGNKRFLYWERMGQPVRSVAGIPNNQVTESQIGFGVELVAKFESEDKDVDQDGLPDWLEKERVAWPQPFRDPTGTASAWPRAQVWVFALSRRPEDQGWNHPTPERCDSSGSGGYRAPTCTTRPRWGRHTRPLDFDTDGDGSSDAEELTNGTNPRDTNPAWRILPSFLNGTLSLWLDASDLTQVGTTWADKSGHERHATMHGSPSSLPISERQAGHALRNRLA